LDYPLTTDTNVFRQRRLVEFEAFAPVANDGTKVGR
jgi:hypothetical protein